jgi:hypothetical protein
MKVHDRKGVATHPGPESCVSAREGRRSDESRSWSRSVDRGSVGRAIEPRKQDFGVLTPLLEAEGNIGRCASASAVPDPARSKTPSMRGSSMCENREISRLSAMDGMADRMRKALL